MLWVCGACTTSYSVDAPRCPHCGSTDYREDDGMPKSTLHGGASIGAPTIGEPRIGEAEPTTEPEESATEPDGEPEPDADGDGVNDVTKAPVKATRSRK